MDSGRSGWGAYRFCKYRDDTKGMFSMGKRR